MILQLVTKLIPSGAFRDPIQAVEHILSLYTHLELDLVVHFVWACITYWRMDGHEPWNELDRTATSKNDSVIAQDQIIKGLSAVKRSVEDPDYELPQLV